MYWLFIEIVDATWSVEEHGYGIKEFNLLLILRLQDMHTQLSKIVNDQFVAFRFIVVVDFLL